MSQLAAHTQQSVKFKPRPKPSHDNGEANRKVVYCFQKMECVWQARPPETSTDVRMPIVRSQRIDPANRADFGGIVLLQIARSGLDGLMAQQLLRKLHPQIVRVCPKDLDSERVTEPMRAHAGTAPPCFNLVTMLFDPFQGSLSRPRI